MKELTLEIIRNMHDIESDKIFITPNIPEKKLNNAITKYAQNIFKDDVIALIDDTVFGSANDGILATKNSIIIHEAFSKPHLILYSDIKSLYCDENKIYINNKMVTKLIVPGKYDTEKFCQFINKIINYLFGNSDLQKYEEIDNEQCEESNLAKREYGLQYNSKEWKKIASNNFFYNIYNKLDKELYPSKYNADSFFQGIINEFKAAGYNHEDRNEILEITHGFLDIVFNFHLVLVRHTNGDKYLIIGCFDDIYVHELIILLCNKIRIIIKESIYNDQDKVFEIFISEIILKQILSRYYCSIINTDKSLNVLQKDSLKSNTLRIFADIFRNRLDRYLLLDDSYHIAEYIAHNSASIIDSIKDLIKIDLTYKDDDFFEKYFCRQKVFMKLY